MIGRVVGKRQNLWSHIGDVVDNPLSNASSRIFLMKSIEDLVLG
jgi:hypothetical protein